MFKNSCEKINQVVGHDKNATYTTLEEYMKGKNPPSKP